MKNFEVQAGQFWPVFVFFVDFGTSLLYAERAFGGQIKIILGVW